MAREQLCKLADIPQAHQDALREFKAKHGKNWKHDLYVAWDRDTREQWGALRCVRNGYPHVINEL